MSSGAGIAKTDYRLTRFSHGGGCGCKIAPDTLERILGDAPSVMADPRLLVGNDSRDDAAVVALGDGTGIISTTDFFMPIVDDPNDFGRIAAANAISDVYAMGGSPLMAVAILGWPVDRLPASLAGDVISGARSVCSEAGIALAGGHSIDSPEPLFGLAVTGQVPGERIIRNDTARDGDLIYLTKPLGVGILAHAARQDRASEDELAAAVAVMTRLNSAGMHFARFDGVHAMTDVTGFGLLGHLMEVCRGSGLSAVVSRDAVPVLPGLSAHIEAGCVPGGCYRNVESLGGDVRGISEHDGAWLCDPQTSGGLLVTVSPARQSAFEHLALEIGLSLEPLGHMLPVEQVAAPRIEVV